MRVNKLVLRRFMTHEKTDLNLPPAGLVAVTGDNGSGKSSIVEAIAWGLFGETLRGTDPFDDKGGSVELMTDDLTVNRQAGKKKKGLTFDVGNGLQEYATYTKAQEALSALVGDFDLWRRTSVFSSQDAAHFTMATDGERKRLLEAILGLDRFDVALERCRVDRKQVELEQARALATVDQLKARLVAEEQHVSQRQDELAALPVAEDPVELQGQRDRLDKQLAGVTVDHKAMVAELRDTEAALAGKRTGINSWGRAKAPMEAEQADKRRRLAGSAGLRQQVEGLAGTRQELADAEARLAGLMTAKTKHTTESSSWMLGRNRARDAVVNAERALKAAEGQARALVGIPCEGAGKYSACRLIAGAVTARDDLARLQDDLEVAKGVLSQVGEEPQAPFTPDAIERTEGERIRLVEVVKVGQRAEVALAAMAEVQARVDAIARDLEEGEQVAIMLTTEERELSGRVGVLSGQVEELIDELAALTKRQNDVGARLRSVEQAAKQRETAKTALERATIDKGAVEGQLAQEDDKAARLASGLAVLSTTEQVLGLKGVRAHVLGRALGGIEQVANGWLARIAGPGMRLHLSAYTEKKTGGTSDAISLEVEGAGGGHGYRGASGGERRRCDIALLFALAEVAGAAHGLKPGLLLLDEVFDALDDDGVEAVCQVLGDLGETRQVVVISHNDRLVDRLPKRLHLRVEAGVVSVV
jgi:DNA repair exonuclease SbcCD ATPase subunit